MTGKSPGQTVLPGSFWGSHGLFYLAVFALTGLAVYRWGLATAQPPRPAMKYTSTATVRFQGDSRTPGEPERIKRQITSPQYIYRAVRRLGLSAEPPADEDPQATANRVVKQVSRDLRVTADKTSAPGELAVAITYTNQLAQYSAQLANVLAETWAEDCRAEWKRHAQLACSEAREASRRAEQELLGAMAHLDEFSRQQLGPPQAEPSAKPSGSNLQRTGNGRITPAALQESAARASTPATRSMPPLVDNPEWVDLNQRLAVLQQRLAELLVDRTPLHPAVQDAQQRIAELKQQLSATSRTIPPKPSDQPGDENQSTAPPPAELPGGRPSGTDRIDSRPAEPTPGETTLDRAETARQFRGLVDAADRATAAYCRAVGLERQAWQQQRQEPRIELDLAEPSHAPASPAPPRLALLLAALGAGLAVAAGVVMISAGTAIQLPLTTTEQARNILPVPVVGTIPETHPASRLTARRRRPLVRRALIVGGLVLIAGCVGLLLLRWG